MSLQDRRSFIAAALAAPLPLLADIEGPAMCRPDPVGTPFEIFAKVYFEMGNQTLNMTETELRKRCLHWADELIAAVEDIDEGVRVAAAEGLLRHKSPEVAREPLLKVLTNDKEESRRIKTVILEGFADYGWDVKGFSGQVEKLLPQFISGARLDNHGKIKKHNK